MPVLGRDDAHETSMFNLYTSLIPFLGALIIGFFDYLDLEIDDNLIYNICLTTILFFISISL